MTYHGVLDQNEICVQDFYRKRSEWHQLQMEVIFITQFALKKIKSQTLKANPYTISLF